jgi:RRXRR protein/HNH endonuclease
MHRVYTAMTWTKRFCARAPIIEIWIESVKFDTQLLRNPEIAGIEYQQGTLFGYEVREYLLERFGQKCAYCDREDLALEIEHVHPKDKGGVGSIGNLTIACRPCNQAKSNQLLQEFLGHDPERAAKIREQLLAPLKDAAAVNATRYRIVEELQTLGLPVRCFTGGQTKANRYRLVLPKTHWIDAACVGELDRLFNTSLRPLIITAYGRGTRKRTRFTPQGFHQKGQNGRVLGILTSKKRHFGFQTGDIVVANVPSGKKKGRYFGRVAVRKTGSFNIITASKQVQGISHRYCRLVQRADGYSYSIDAFAESAQR